MSRRSACAALLLSLALVTGPRLCTALTIEHDRAAPLRTAHTDSLEALRLDRRQFPVSAGAQAGIFRIAGIAELDTTAIGARCDERALMEVVFRSARNVLRLELLEPIHGRPPREATVHYMGPTELHRLHWSDGGGNVHLATGDIIIGEIFDFHLCERLVLPFLSRNRVEVLGQQAAAVDAEATRAFIALYREFYADSAAAQPEASDPGALPPLQR
jgi:hypothetical protein